MATSSTRRRSILAAGLAALLVASALTTPSLTSAAAGAEAQGTDNLDLALRAEMERQSELAPAGNALWEEQVRAPESGWASLAYEGKGLTLYWKGDLTPGMAAALERARQWGPVVVKPAAYSNAELKAAANRIIAASKKHPEHDIQSIGYESDGSGLEVARGPQVLHPGTVAMRNGPVTSAAQILRESAVDVPVAVVDRPEQMQLTVNRSDDSPPWNGGSKWEAWRGSQDRRATCTTGFGVVSGGRTWVLSAGHCGSPPDDAYQGVWGQSGFDEMGPVHDDDWQSDLLLIDAPGWYKIFDGSANTSTTKVVKGWGGWTVGELVCQSGRTSGTVCGIRQSHERDYFLDCRFGADSDGDCDYTIRGLIEGYQIDGHEATRIGDSGGPVFVLDGSGVRAKGITVGGGGTTFWFQDWATVIQVFNAYPRTG